MIVDREKYDKLVEKKRSWYRSLKPVFCPLLNIDIHFNSKGLNHVFYNGSGKGRTIVERIYRLNLLPLVIPVIKVSDRIVKYKKEFTKSVGKEVEYWRIKGLVGQSKLDVTVILRRIGTGNVTFHSVFCKKQKKAILTRKKTKKSP